MHRFASGETDIERDTRLAIDAEVIFAHATRCSWSPVRTNALRACAVSIACCGTLCIPFLGITLRWMVVRPAGLFTCCALVVDLVPRGRGVRPTLTNRAMAERRWR